MSGGRGRVSVEERKSTRTIFGTDHHILIVLSGSRQTGERTDGQQERKRHRGKKLASAALPHRLLLNKYCCKQRGGGRSWGVSEGERDDK